MASLGSIKVVIDATTKAFISKLKEADQVAEAWHGSMKDKMNTFSQVFANRLNKSAESLGMMSRGLNKMGRGMRSIAWVADDVQDGFRNMFETGTKGSESFRKSMIGASESVAGITKNAALATSALIPMIDVSIRGGTLMKAFFASIVAFSPKLTKALSVAKAGFLAVLGPVALVTGAVVGLALLIAFNFDKATVIITKLTNSFIRFYNNSLPLRVLVQSLAYEFRVFGLVGQFIVHQFTNAFGTIGKLIIKVKEILHGHGSFKDLGKIVAEGINNALASTDKLAEGIRDSFQQAIGDSQKLIPEVKLEDVRERMSGFEKFGDFIRNLFKKKDGGDLFEAINEAIEKTDRLLKNQLLAGNKTAAAETFVVLERLKERLEDMETQIKQMSDPFGALKDQFSELEDTLTRQVLAEDWLGVSKTLSDLTGVEMKIKGVEKQVESLKSRDVSDLFFTSPVPVNIDFESPTERIQVLNSEAERLKGVMERTNNVNVFNKAENDLKEVQDELQLLSKNTPTIMGNFSKAAEKGWKKFFEITKETLKEAQKLFGETFGQGMADLITNLFQGVDNEKIAQLNDELERNREILSDQTATNEQRKAARAQVDAIKEQIKQEKQRGNIIVQTAALVIDSAKKVINALLAEAIAGAIAGESKKGLLGLFTAGIAVAGISALFRSKVPKLSAGGVLDRDTIFRGGEYPGAIDNPEIVAPLNTLAPMLVSALETLLGPIGGFRGNISPGNQRFIQNNTRPAYVVERVPYISESRIEQDDMVLYLRQLNENQMTTTGQGLL